VVEVFLVMVLFCLAMLGCVFYMLLQKAKQSARETTSLEDILKDPSRNKVWSDLIRQERKEQIVEEVSDVKAKKASSTFKRFLSIE